MLYVSGDVEGGKTPSGEPAPETKPPCVALVHDEFMVLPGSFRSQADTLDAWPGIWYRLLRHG